MLQKEDELNEIVQLVGKDSLAESDKIVLETARFIKDDYLQQNSFTKCVVGVCLLRVVAVVWGGGRSRPLSLPPPPPPPPRTPCKHHPHTHSPPQNETKTKNQKPNKRYDRYCPFYKSVGMMKNISTFHRLATAAVEKTASGNADGARITLNVIKQRLSDTLYKLTSQKFEDPSDGEAAVAGKLKGVHDELVDRFRALEEDYR